MHSDSNSVYIDCAVASLTVSSVCIDCYVASLTVSSVYIDSNILSCTLLYAKQFVPESACQTVYYMQDETIEPVLSVSSIHTLYI
jgi:hypothetical protein